MRCPSARWTGRRSTWPICRWRCRSIRRGSTKTTFPGFTRFRECSRKLKRFCGPAQCQGVIAADPFLKPTMKFPSGISAEDQHRLTQEITGVVLKEVLPAYQAFGKFIAEEYAPYGRTTLS